MHLKKLSKFTLFVACMQFCFVQFWAFEPGKLYSTTARSEWSARSPYLSVIHLGIRDRERRGRRWGRTVLLLLLMMAVLLLVMLGTGIMAGHRIPVINQVVIVIEIILDGVIRDGDGVPQIAELLVVVNDLSAQSALVNWSQLVDGTVQIITAGNISHLCHQLVWRIVEFEPPWPVIHRATLQLNWQNFRAVLSPLLRLDPRKARASFLRIFPAFLEFKLLNKLFLF